MARRFSDRALRDAALAPENELLERLATSARGLTESEARLRLETHGHNRVAHERPPAWTRQLLHSFANPFVLLLLLIATVSFVTGDREATAIIAVMVGLSVSLRFWQERRSVVAAERLRAMVKVTTNVVRQTDLGERTGGEIAIEEIVPGDVVLLSAGDMIPADVRLIAAKDLFVSQAVLTGESVPVEKSSGPLGGPIETLAASNLCFLGTNVVSGTAIAVVVATGSQTYFGSLARSVIGARTRNSFDVGVHQVSMLLIRTTLVMTALVFFINGLTKHDWSSAFLFALSVAVGLTPEMLPMVVSATLALGSLTLSRKKVIVKQLAAIQNLGALDILCADKTGTLTRNKVILVRYCDVAGEEDSEAVFRLAYLNSFHQTGLSNVLDRAILEHRELPLEGARKVDEIPFDFSRRIMSVVVDTSGARQLIAKGAPAEVLDRSSEFELNGEVLPIEQLLIPALNAEIEKLNRQGFRVLAVASKEVPSSRDVFTREDEYQLVLRGYIAFLDPAKETAAEAISALIASGVSIKILTGDNEIVTQAICAQVGLPVDRVVLGSEVEAIDDAALAPLAEAVTVFARLTPAHKERVVKALRGRGHVVGFMGDGINDAPALRAADVGISVNNAVDIAKESADIILLEKNLLVLEDGVLEGRRVFGNLIKYIRMGLSSNFGNIFSVIGASIFLPFLPMMPIQLLIQNLLYDFSQMAIPFDAVDEEYVRAPRKWKIRHIARFMLSIGPISSIFDYTTFALMFFVFTANTPARQHLFQSGWFVEGLLSQTLIVHMIRTRRIPFIQSRPALPLLLATLAIMVVGIALPFTSFGAGIGLEPLPRAYFGWLAATLFAYMVLTQLAKTWFAKRFGYN